MSHQVDSGPLVKDEFFEVGDRDISFEGVFDGGQEPSRRVLTQQEQENAAYVVFADYANRQSGNYQDVIARDLRLNGVAAAGRNDILRLYGLWKDYFVLEEKNRYLTFSWRGKSEDVLALAGGKTAKAVILWILALAIFVSASLLTASFFHFRETYKEPAPVAEFSAPALANPLLQPEAVPAVKDAPSAIAAEDIRASRSSLADSVSALIDSGRFILALKIIRDPSNLFDSGFARQANNRINVLVLNRADSLNRVITGLIEEGKHREAFELERRFDKELFQLAGNDFSRRLSQRLLKAWVYSYKGWCSKDSAIAMVNTQIQSILSPSYLVKDDGKGNVYLEYAPTADRSRGAKKGI